MLTKKLPLYIQFLLVFGRLCSSNTYEVFETLKPQVVNLYTNANERLHFWESGLRQLGVGVFVFNPSTQVIQAGRSL